MEEIEYRVNNWENYNPRRDRKKHSWFKLDNHFFDNKKLFPLSLVDRMVLIFLFCESSQSYNGEKDGFITLNLDYVCHKLRIEKKNFLKSIQVIENTGVIITATSGCQLTPNGCLQTNKQTNKQQEQKPKSVIKKGAICQFDDPFHFDLLKLISHDAQNNWLKAYSDIFWIKSELSKMVTWISENPRKAPKKDYSRFVGSWLRRAHENEIKNPKNKIQNALNKLELIKQQNFGD